MTPKYVVTSGSKYTYLEPTGQLIGSSINYTAASYDYLTCPAMNIGDHVTPTNWSYTAEKCKYWYGTMYTYEPNYTLRDVGYFSGELPRPREWDRTLVYNMCLEKFNSLSRGKMDLGVSLAEAHTTARMIKSLGKFTSFAKLNGFGSTRDVAKGWLSWQYGWKPLMSDIFGIADESVRIVLNAVERIQTRVTLPILDDVIVQQVGGATCNVSRKGRGKQSCTISCKLEIPSFDLTRWSSLNPVSLTWELIPYSFVIDWFVDVGSYLRNLETAMLYNSRFIVGYVSELYAWEGIFDVHNKPIYPSNRTFINTQARLRERKFVRTRLTSYPVPRQPTFNVDLNSSRLLSAASLLRLLLKR